jgi:hypothetical protein
MEQLLALVKLGQYFTYLSASVLCLCALNTTAANAQLDLQGWGIANHIWFMPLLVGACRYEYRSSSGGSGEMCFVMVVSEQQCLPLSAV